MRALPTIVGVAVQTAFAVYWLPKPNRHHDVLQSVPGDIAELSGLRMVLGLNVQSITVLSGGHTVKFLSGGHTGKFLNGGHTVKSPKFQKA